MKKSTTNCVLDCAASSFVDTFSNVQAQLLNMINVIKLTHYSSMVTCIIEQSHTVSVAPP